MVIKSNLHLGKGFVRGDEFSIVRKVPRVPITTTITAAYLTFKSTISDLDAAATVQKSITVSNVDGTGQIENNGSAGVGTIRFDMNEADTLLFTANAKYFFDVQVKLSSGDIFTLEKGDTTFDEQVTISS